MSEKSAVTTRSKLRKLAAEMNTRRALESDSGVPSEMAPASPSIAPTTSTSLAPVIPLAGGRLIDHSIFVTPTGPEKRQSARRSSRGSRTLSHGSTKSAQRNADHLRRRVEYEAEREIVRLKENLVKKKLEADFAEIDAAEGDSDTDEEGTSRRVEDWINTSPQQVMLSAPPASIATREVSVPVMSQDIHVPAVSRDAPAHRDQTVTDAAPVPTSDIPAPRHKGAPAPVQFREPVHRVLAAPIATTSASRVPPARDAFDWDNTFTEDAEQSRPRDRKIDQLAEVIASLARPRPVPKQAFELPYFNGNPADWLSYKNMYWDTTAMYQFKPHENLARLKTSLQGDAKLAVEDLLRTSTNPADIMKALDEEFGHPNLLLECALKKVRALPKVTESGHELRKFSTTVRNCVSLMRNINANGYLNNPQLVSELLYKLTPVQRAQYGDFAMGLAATQGVDVRVSPSLEILSDFLIHLARATSYYVQLDMSTPGASNTAARTQKSVPPTRQVNNVRNSQRVHVHSDKEQTANKKEAQCTLCGEAHALPNCGKFSELNLDERWEHVKTNRLCFKCISRRHSRNFCRAKRCETCNYAHHTLLHVEKQVTESVTNVNDYCGKALLKILPVSVNINDQENECYALLDDGATVSLIDSVLTGNVKGIRRPLVIHSARGLEITDTQSREVSVTVRGPNGQCHVIKCRTLKNLDLPAQTVPAHIMSEHAHLRDLGCEEMRGAKPLLLLGQDNWELLVSEETRRGKSGKPVASRTKLGWVIHGPISRDSVHREHTVNCIMSSLPDLHEMVKHQFELEAIGVRQEPRKHWEIERANLILDKTSRLIDGNTRWEVGLLWRQDDVILPDNFKYAKHRLAGVERRLGKDPVYAKAYAAQINRLLQEGYARKIDGGVVADPVWYLPHFGVTNPNKPGKLRLVFDAAAAYQGTSLNDKLLAGPDLLNSLLGVLFKFRSGSIAFTADIADMFLRIRIREEDQGAQLFLWRGESKDREPETYAMNSMVFGAVSSPAAAIYVLNKNARRFINDYPDAVKAIETKHYMDDYLDSVWSIEEANQLIEQVTHIHASGGFTIRGWVTNSARLREKLRLEMPDRVSLDKGEDAPERTLGMIWSPNTDQLAFDLSFKRLPKKVTEGKSIPTKREFLRAIMSIFDPLGFLYPCVIQSRILMQRIWKSGIQWDEPLRDSEVQAWFDWLNNLHILREVNIPRWYGLRPDDLELHVFGDASELAYAAVAYIAGINYKDERDVAIVIGKARVAPQKVVSIPRLELQAAVLACRLADTVERELGLPITKKFLWTNSKTVLKWIHSDAKEFQKFVSFRLGEIDQKSERGNWRWVPSAENPADKATKLDWPNNCSEWLVGPAFLRDSQERWPVCGDTEAAEADLERVQRVHVVSTQAEPLMDYARISTWARTLRVIARVIIFTDRCRKRRQTAAVKVEDVREAELRLLKLMQAESFQVDLAALKGSEPLPTHSRLRPLDPMIFEDGLIRVRGRLSACEELSFGERHPIILDGKHPLTIKLIYDYHATALHANQEAVINHIRERFWVTNLRSAVKAVTTRCQQCRLNRGVLFTCLTTRAVHVELAASLSADSAILALRRLIARRGRPTHMFSDRGTNFVGANSELRAALRNMDHTQVEDEAISKGMSWQFNPPAAPHMGGCWERLVRSIKNALKATLKERAPREEVLYTLLAEAELTVNSRPLTYVTSDVDQPVVLTPNHLLLGTATGDAPFIRRVSGDIDSRRLWRKANALADLFWKRWLREYLPSLQRRHKWVQNVPNVKVGDVVVIVDDNKPRNQWTKGVIKAVYPGQDSIVRIVDVNTKSGVLRRPVVKIVVLPTDGSVIG